MYLSQLPIVIDQLVQIFKFLSDSGHIFFNSFHKLFLIFSPFLHRAILQLLNPSPQQLQAFFNLYSHLINQQHNILHGIQPTIVKHPNIQPLSFSNQQSQVRFPILVRNPDLITFGIAKELIKLIFRYFPPNFLIKQLIKDRFFHNLVAFDCKNLNTELRSIPEKIQCSISLPINFELPIAFGSDLPKRVYQFESGWIFLLPIIRCLTILYLCLSLLFLHFLYPFSKRYNYRFKLIILVANLLAFIFF